MGIFILGSVPWSCYTDGGGGLLQEHGKQRELLSCPGHVVVPGPVVAQLLSSVAEAEASWKASWFTVVTPFS